ncbi:30S ribosomal protein S18 [Spiroplasma clarkii]|uniref:Small ribosomal subunit protein bS18 n=1 Tax=Spiroplasma clarkii TaxID=2139 RepID=A0A1Y0KZE7_9MOLU|nr:30S ribosomal protein S18 [Spiroplasma clarkii]ARU90910.1 30S ribosomal protein S18 [Spiroplasma clarkii]ATX70361.1 30S ribosomal protein S18 [Spiroplasma clarkii]
MKKFVRRKKVNFFAKNNIDYIDYKDVELLKKFISGNGQILPRRITGTSPKHQRMLATAIKRARVVGLLPFVVQ